MVHLVYLGVIRIVWFMLSGTGLVLPCPFLVIADDFSQLGSSPVHSCVGLALCCSVVRYRYRYSVYRWSSKGMGEE